MRTLTAEEIETFRRDGAVCLRGVLPTDLIAAMAGPVEVALDGGQSADLSALAGAPAEQARFRAGVDHWRHQAEMLAFSADSPLPGIVAALMDSAAVFLYEDSVLAKEPGAVERTHWHQDLGYFHIEGTQVCTTWCPLDPVDADSGAVRFAVGSHRTGAFYRPNFFVSDEPIPGTEGDVVPDVEAAGFEIVSFDLEPGDITVHDARTLHSSGPNRTTDRRRRAISVRYCGDDARYRFRPGTPRKPEQADLADGDPLGAAAHPQVWPVNARA